MAAVQLVILLSLGNFQAILPSPLNQPSPVFVDSAQGAADLVRWVKATVPPPGFAQPPLRVCVVGAVPFTAEQAPYLPKPLWESQPPFRSLEPYAATFNYVEVPPGAKVPRPRTLRDAVKLCAAEPAGQASRPGS